MESIKNKKIIGRREYVSIPEFELFDIKAKIDTGARGNAIDCSKIEEFEKDGKKFIRFVLLNKNRDAYTGNIYETDVFKKVKIKSAFGDIQERYLIYANLIFKGEHIKTKIGLNDRANLPYPILLGRRVLKKFLIDVNESFTN